MPCDDSQRLSAWVSIAPEVRAASSPFRNRMRLGMPRMWWRIDTCGCASVSTLAKRTRVPSSAATCWNTGAIILQGPHQSAQKSTSTGRPARAMKRSKLSAARSIGLPGRINEPHLPHFGESARRSSGTRLTARQWGQASSIGGFLEANDLASRWWRAPENQARTRQGRSGAIQQRHQFAGGVERRGVVETANVGVADEYLRHGAAAAGAGDHLVLLRGVEIDADLFDLGDAAALEQALGGDAVRANGGAVHHNFGHQKLLISG